MKKLLSLAVSLGLLALIYFKIDLQALGNTFRQSSPFWMLVSSSMVVPLTSLTAWRLQQLAPRQAGLGLGEATRLTLAASVLNMVLPSKMGDIAKAYFIKQRGRLDGSLALSLVVFEKACDLLSLLVWCAFGLLFYPAKDWLFWSMTAAILIGLSVGLALLASRAVARRGFTLGRALLPKKLRPKLEQLQHAWLEMHAYFWQDLAHLRAIAIVSLLIWFLHLVQIWLFIIALRAWVPLVANLALAPLAILAGLLPLTFAGVGTRDGALIFFYQPYFDAATGAALGLLCTSRYLLPALGGLPFFNQYFLALQSSENRRQKAQE